MDQSTADFTRQWTAALPMVSAFVGSMVFDASDRDDVLQDCAMAAITSFERFDSSRPFTAWAIGIARNQVRLYLRRKSGDRLVLDDTALDQLVTAFSRVQKDREHQLDKLETCVGSLKRRAREICELRYVENLKPAAIGERLGLPANTVSKALQRIREELRDCLNSPTISQS
ncbi:MAG: sigma-70 family RNA polymerase sigma factor [Akkermansiaceae bacterium]|jgi:RNA polymerase sigma-70 factor (ECF subfamily)